VPIERPKREGQVQRPQPARQQDHQGDLEPVPRRDRPKTMKPKSEYTDRTPAGSRGVANTADQRPCRVLPDGATPESPAALPTVVENTRETPTSATASAPRLHTRQHLLIEAEGALHHTASSPAASSPVPWSPTQCQTRSHRSRSYRKRLVDPTPKLSEAEGYATQRQIAYAGSTPPHRQDGSWLLRKISLRHSNGNSCLDRLQSKQQQGVSVLLAHRRTHRNSACGSSQQRIRHRPEGVTESPRYEEAATRPLCPWLPLGHRGRSDFDPQEW
jgi:hypothetical protein